MSQGSMDDLNAALLLQRGQRRAYTLEARGDTARMRGDYQVRLSTTSADVHAIAVQPSCRVG